MPRDLMNSRRRALAIYATLFVGAIGLTIAFCQLGAMRSGTALPFAAFDVGTLGFITISLRPAALPLDLRGFGDLYNASVALWAGTLYGPANSLGERLGLPAFAVGLSTMLALILVLTVMHAALFTPEERAALRMRQAPRPG